MHEHIKVIRHSEIILVTLDWFQSMNELLSLDMKINDCSMSVNHKFFLFLKVKCSRLIILGAQDTTFVVVTVCDLLHLCHFTADTSDENTLTQMSQLSETTSGTVSEHTRHVSTLDDTLVILEGLRGLVIAIAS